MYLEYNMRYYLHNSSSARLRQVFVKPKAVRIDQLKARIASARDKAKSDVGPIVNEVYTPWKVDLDVDEVGNLIQWTKDTGWRDVN